MTKTYHRKERWEVTYHQPFGSCGSTFGRTYRTWIGARFDIGSTLSSGLAMRAELRRIRRDS